MIDPLIGRAIAAGFALLWLLAAWHKLSAGERFVAALAEYRLLPSGWVRPLARALAIVEAALGLGWLTGLLSGLVASLSATLLGAYALAIAVNLGRGRVHIGCGCGLGAASGDDPSLSWWLVARNLLLAAVALVAVLPPSSRELGMLDGLTLVLALLATVALYAGASQLLRNGAAIASWRRPHD
jgi:Methylamine utilisation protein MauE